MEHPFVPLQFERLPIEESRAHVREFLETAARRRSVRDFSPDPVPADLIDSAIEAASTAPSGANRQPWKFVVVTNSDVKRRIREAAEEEERRFYETRATPEWLADLAPLGTDWRKPFLEIAPYLIVVFRMDYEPARLADGTQSGSGHKHKNYYVQESVGIAVGILIAALNAAGLATLTHTPSPMGFLREALGRPKHEQPFVLIPVGYPAEGARVPDLRKKSLDEVREWV